MKKLFAFVTVLFILTAFCVTMFVHAGDLPIIPLTGSSTLEESSTVPEEPDTEERTTAPLLLSDKKLKMKYKSTDYLTASTRVIWSSSDPEIVTVDDEGNLTAVGRGEATITATSWDGRTASCEVTVRYSFWQIIVIIFLFGWIWYK